MSRCPVMVLQSNEHPEGWPCEHPLPCPHHTPNPKE